MVWVTDVNSDVRAIITHRDQICCEVFMYERGDKMEDLLKLMSSSDEERIRNILEVQAEGTSKRYHEFATRRVYDLAAWAKKAKRSSIVSYYPKHSSSEDYE